MRLDVIAASPKWIWHAPEGSGAVSREDSGPTFTVLERHVVRLGLSRHEPAALLRPGPPGFGRRLRSVLFGTPDRTPLASDRLEALRAMAAALRRGPTPDPELTRAFLAAGWTAGHIDTIRMLISDARRHRADDRPTGAGRGAAGR